MTVAVVAEKPSVARDIARVLGASQRGDGRLSGGGYVVTWAIGHLVRLAEPPEIRPEWKRWAAGDLPLLPSEWPLVVAERTQDQFRAVKRVLRDPDVTEIVCATDAGREGELIFRYILAAAECRKPVRRLWISSLTPEAIKRGFSSLRPLSDFDPLADSAHARARADWLVGMNLSRAATLAHGELFSVGRVQTPTLALLVEREKAIRAFVAEEYLEVEAEFASDEAAAAEPGRDAPAPGWCLPRDVVPRRPADARGPAIAEGRSRGEGHRRASAERTGAGGVGRVGDAPPPAAAPLRPHRAAAAREPAPRPLREGDAGRRAGALRGEEAPHLPAHRQPAPLERRGRGTARGGRGDRGALLPAPRPRDRRAAPGPALRGRLEGDRPPRHRPHRGLGRRARPEPRRAPRLRPRVPAAAHGVARRSRLRGHLGRHAGVERLGAWTASRARAPRWSRSAGRPSTRLSRARPGRRPAATGGTTRAIRRRTSRRASPPASRSASPRSKPSRRRRGRPAASPTRRC